MGHLLQLPKGCRACRTIPPAGVGVTRRGRSGVYSDQLVEVVTQDWWVFELPERFADEGAELAPYEERDLSIYAT